MNVKVTGLMIQSRPARDHDRVEEERWDSLTFHVTTMTS